MWFFGGAAALKRKRRRGWDEIKVSAADWSLMKYLNIYRYIFVSLFVAVSFIWAGSLEPPLKSRKREGGADQTRPDQVNVWLQDDYGDHNDHDVGYTDDDDDDGAVAGTAGDGADGDDDADVDALKANVTLG